MDTRLRQFILQIKHRDGGIRGRAVQNISSKLRHGLLDRGECAGNSLLMEALLGFFREEDVAAASDAGLKALELLHDFSGIPASARLLLRVRAVAFFEEYRGRAPAGYRAYLDAILANLLTIRSSGTTLHDEVQVELEEEAREAHASQRTREAERLKLSLRDRVRNRKPGATEVFFTDLRAKVAHTNPELTHFGASLLHQYVAYQLDPLLWVEEGNVLVEVCDALPLLARRTPLAALDEASIILHAETLARIIEGLLNAPPAQRPPRIEAVTCMLAVAFGGALAGLEGGLLRCRVLDAMTLLPGLFAPGYFTVAHPPAAAASPSRNGRADPAGVGTPLAQMTSALRVLVNALGKGLLEGVRVRGCGACSPSSLLEAAQLTRVLEAVLQHPLETRREATAFLRDRAAGPQINPARCVLELMVLPTVQSASLEADVDGDATPAVDLAPVHNTHAAALHARHPALYARLVRVHRAVMVATPAPAVSPAPVPAPTTLTAAAMAAHDGGSVDGYAPPSPSDTAAPAPAPATPVYEYHHPAAPAPGASGCPASVVATAAAIDDAALVADAVRVCASREALLDALSAGTALVCAVPHGVSALWARPEARDDAIAGFRKFFKAPPAGAADALCVAGCASYLAKLAASGVLTNDAVLAIADLAEYDLIPTLMKVNATATTAADATPPPTTGLNPDYFTAFPQAAEGALELVDTLVTALRERSTPERIVALATRSALVAHLTALFLAPAVDGHPPTKPRSPLEWAVTDYIPSTLLRFASRALRITTGIVAVLMDAAAVHGSGPPEMVAEVHAVLGLCMRFLTSDPCPEELIRTGRHRHAAFARQWADCAAVCTAYLAACTTRAAEGAAYPMLRTTRQAQPSGQLSLSDASTPFAAGGAGWGLGVDEYAVASLAAALPRHYYTIMARRVAAGQLEIVGIETGHPGAVQEAVRLITDIAAQEEVGAGGDGATAAAAAFLTAVLVRVSGDAAPSSPAVVGAANLAVPEDGNGGTRHPRDAALLLAHRLREELHPSLFDMVVPALVARVKALRAARVRATVAGSGAHPPPRITAACAAAGTCEVHRQLAEGVALLTAAYRRDPAVVSPAWNIKRVGFWGALVAEAAEALDLGQDEGLEGPRIPSPTRAASSITTPPQQRQGACVEADGGPTTTGTGTHMDLVALAARLEWSRGVFELLLCIADAEGSGGGGAATTTRTDAVLPTLLEAPSVPVLRFVLRALEVSVALRGMRGGFAADDAGEWPMPTAAGSTHSPAPPSTATTSLPPSRRGSDGVFTSVGIPEGGDADALTTLGKTWLDVVNLADDLAGLAVYFTCKLFAQASWYVRADTLKDPRVMGRILSLCVEVITDASRTHAARAAPCALLATGIAADAALFRTLLAGLAATATHEDAKPRLHRLIDGLVACARAGLLAGPDAAATTSAAQDALGGILTISFEAKAYAVTGGAGGTLAAPQPLLCFEEWLEVVAGKQNGGRPHTQTRSPTQERSPRLPLGGNGGGVGPKASRGGAAASQQRRGSHDSEGLGDILKSVDAQKQLRQGQGRVAASPLPSPLRSGSAPASTHTGMHPSRGCRAARSAFDTASPPPPPATDRALAQAVYFLTSVLRDFATDELFAAGDAEDGAPPSMSAACGVHGGTPWVVALGRGLRALLHSGVLAAPGKTAASVSGASGVSTNTSAPAPLTTAAMFTQTLSTSASVSTLLPDGRLSTGASTAAAAPTSPPAAPRAATRASHKLAVALLKLAKEYLLLPDAGAEGCAVYKDVVGFALAYFTGARGEGGLLALSRVGLELLSCVGAGGRAAKYLEVVPPQQRQALCEALGGWLCAFADTDPAGALPILAALAELALCDIGQDMVPRIPGVWDLLLGTLQQPALAAAAPTEALLLLRNLAFRPLNKAVISRDERVRDFFMEALRSTLGDLDTVKRKWLALSALWALLYNSEKVKPLWRPVLTPSVVRGILACLEHHIAVESAARERAGRAAAWRAAGDGKNNGSGSPTTTTAPSPALVHDPVVLHLLHECVDTLGCVVKLLA